MPTDVGAPPVGSARLPVPTSPLTRVVAPSGSDAAAGTAEAPWRTVAFAVDNVPNGGTIVLRGGVYRESAYSERRASMIQAWPGEAVWFDGADPVTGWVADGSAWRRDNWNVRFDRNAYASGQYNSESPLAGWPDMVFVDGAPMTEVNARSKVVPGTFFADYANAKLYVGTNPAGRLVEASVRSSALTLKVAGSGLKGVGVRRYANTAWGLGVVKGIANNLTFESNVFERNAAGGLTVSRAGIRIVANTFRNNGLVGLHGNEASNVLVEGNLIEGNNAALFLLGSGQEGGMKFTRSSNMVWRGNLVQNNNGNGLWCDLYCDDLTIVKNVSRNNGRNGLTFELSTNGIIASNVIYGNGLNGVYALESSSVNIWNNTLFANDVRQLNVTDGVRPEAVNVVTIRNNVLSGATTGTQTQLAVIDANDQRTAAQMGVTANHDAFFRVSPTSPEWLATWSNGPLTPVLATSIADMRTRTTAEDRGMEANGSSNPYIANANGLSFGRPAGSPAVAAGQPLPAPIADAIGVGPGTPVDIGVLSLTLE